MHAFDLAKIASVYVQQAESQVVLRCCPSKESTHAYWLTNRYRIDHWSSRLAAHRKAIQRPGVSYRSGCWRVIVPVMQEVLLSEPVTRCIAYHASVLEEAEIDFDFAPLAQSVLTSHVEARNRCLHLLVFGAGLSVDLAVRLNRLRRSMETYTDELLSMMRPIQAIDQISFDPPVTTKGPRQLPSDSSNSCQRLHTAAVLERFSRTCSPDVDSRIGNRRLNYRVSQVLLELLPTSQFDSFGLPKSHESAKLTIQSSESSIARLSRTKPLNSPLDILHPVDGSRLVEPSDRRWS